MKVTFLGTGTSQGVPVIGCKCPVCTSIDFRDKRLRTSIAVEVDGLHLVIDTGPDFRQQMLAYELPKLDAILFTHEHKDHVAGLDDVRAFNHLQHKAMPVYGSKAVLAHLKTEFAYIFAEKKYPGIPQISIYEFDNEPFVIQGVEIIPIQVMHNKMPVKGFRIKDFTYITDANYIPPQEKDKVKGSKVLVLNGLQHEPHISHFTLAQAIEQINELQTPCNYITHISHKLGRHRDVSRNLPEHVKLAFDGLVVTID